jgi:hypothetical protein
MKPHLSIELSCRLAGLLGRNTDEHQLTPLPPQSQISRYLKSPKADEQVKKAWVIFYTITHDTTTKAVEWCFGDDLQDWWDVIL